MGRMSTVRFTSALPCHLHPTVCCYCGKALTPSLLTQKEITTNSQEHYMPESVPSARYSWLATSVERAIPPGSTPIHTALPEVALKARRLLLCQGLTAKGPADRLKPATGTTAGAFSVHRPKDCYQL